MERLVLPGLALAYGAASVAVALDFDPVAPTTYAATSSGAAAADIAAGLGLLLAGLLVWWERPAGSIGPVAVLLGVVWFAPDWVGWEQGPALVRSVAMLAAPFLAPLLVHLVLAVPGGRVEGRRARLVLALAYGAAALVGIGRALFRDPFLDQYCWSNCTDNVFLVHADPDLARTVGDTGLWLSVAAGGLIVVFACLRLLSATRPWRTAAWPVLVPAALAALALVAYPSALLDDPAEDPDGSVFHDVFLAAGLAFSCLAVGLAWTVVRRRRTRDAIKRLAGDLGATPEPGSLRAALAGSLGDAGLEVAYRVPGTEAYVDAEGRPVQVPAGGGRATTPIVRGGEPVALVIHDRALPGAQELEREIGAAARLAVDNERLRAETLAQLEDLRSSRARIVEAGDSARRRIERDLHDGAQQRLLGIRLALRHALERSDPALLQAV
ncbi:MAG TPA: histidine kinase dimerization/phosphoacceptor domain-containing protein, partial [Thermoleophilaceae bacterium]|nr:histidine kinase dimerization/phosphoacceptor domain-containing protein [Thermoleophilaceae bacterium]